MTLAGRSFLKEIDFTKSEILQLVELGSELRRDSRTRSRTMSSRGAISR